MAKELEKQIDEKEKNKSKSQLPSKTNTEIELWAMIWNTIEEYRLYVFPEAYKIVKNKLLFAWDIKMTNKKLWRPNDTAAVYPLTEWTVDTFVANLYDSVSVPKVAARWLEDKELANYAQDFSDWAHDISWATKIKQKGIIWSS